MRAPWYRRRTGPHPLDPRGRWGAGLAAPRRLGVALALATLALDQGSKLWVLHALRLEERGRVEVLPFLDLVMVWNRGISYGLFQQGTETGRWGLLAVTLAATGVMAAWMWRTASPWAAAGLGLVVGGALGNAADRAAYGAVADFARLHWGAWSWYVFNVADAAIVAGVGLLLYDALVAERRRARPAPGA